MASILVTGGAGYIGTHVLAALAADGHRCLCVDNYSNSTPRALQRLRRIGVDVEAYECDLRDERRLAAYLATREVDSVIHLAGLKAVGESVERPLLYYDNNIGGTLTLLRVLAARGIRRLVFSSSATVYGVSQRMPVAETAPTAPQSAYGHTKLMAEQMLADLVRSDSSWKVASLRYFNPVGAHESGMIGESPEGVPNNLMPNVCQVAAGRKSKLTIFGRDYATPDGTGIRDFIHVMDLAEGHVAAIGSLEAMDGGGLLTVNLGTGRGYSVLELLDTFERVNGVPVPRKFAARRPGDVPVCYADCSRARDVLAWTARRGLEEMCRDAWRWQSLNPSGYASRIRTAGERSTWIPTPRPRYRSSSRSWSPRSVA